MYHRKGGIRVPVFPLAVLTGSLQLMLLSFGLLISRLQTPPPRSSSGASAWEGKARQSHRPRPFLRPLPIYLPFLRSPSLARGNGWAEVTS